MTLIDPKGNSCRDTNKTALCPLVVEVMIQMCSFLGNVFVGRN